jgi:hypothetical protein
MAVRSIWGERNSQKRLTGNSGTGYLGRDMEVITVSHIKKDNDLLQALADGEGLADAAERLEIDRPTATALPRIVSPKARHWVRGLIQGRIDIEAAPEAYQVMLRLLRDSKTPSGQKIEISKFFISHSIAAPKAKEEDNGHEKNPSEMTNDELRASLAKSDAELARRNMVIDVTPTQTIDDII